MPPFTSTSWTTIVRRTVAAARQQVVHSKAATRAALLAKRRAFNYARSALHETFPSLSQPTFQRLRPQLAPLPISTSPLQRAALRVRTSGTRFASSYPRGAAVPARVGLNSTRNFSTTIAANNPGVALIVRGIYGIRDEDITRWGADKWSRNWSPAVRHSHKRRRRCSAQNTPSSIYRQKNVNLTRSRTNQVASSQMDQFFPLISTISRQEQTENATTTLSISCIPSEDLLSNSPAQSTSPPAAEIGVNQFADLLYGLLAVPLAYSNHQSKNVIPLIKRLRAVGILDDVGRTAVRMNEDVAQGVIHITFPYRSARNVRALLGDVHGEDDWYYLKETTALSSAQIREINGLFVGIFSDTVSPNLGFDQSNSFTQSDVSSVSSRSRSTILNGIPDVESGFSTPADIADSMCCPLEIGTSSSDLVFPRIDTISVDEGVLTPPYMSYTSIISEEEDDPSWSDDHMSTASSLSAGTASWASIENNDDDIEDVWSDGGMSESLESGVDLRRNVSTDEMRDSSLYGVMMPF